VGVRSAIDNHFHRVYGLFVFLNGGPDMVAYFELQPVDSELQQLAEQYWQKSGERERKLEKAAFEAGEAIRSGDYSLANLEAIARWKSERVVHYLIGNSNEKIKSALAVAASPDASTEDAVNALVELHGVDIPVASAILAAIYPERYTVLDVHALEALGHAATTFGFMPNTTPIASGSPNAGSLSRKGTCPRRHRSALSTGRFGSGREADRSSSRCRSRTAPVAHRAE
jgi:hypothetical protein